VVVTGLTGAAFCDGHPPFASGADDGSFVLRRYGATGLNLTATSDIAVDLNADKEVKFQFYNPVAKQNAPTMKLQMYYDQTLLPGQLTVTTCSGGSKVLKVDPPAFIGAPAITASSKVADADNTITLTFKTNVEICDYAVVQLDGIVNVVPPSPFVLTTGDNDFTAAIDTSSGTVLLTKKSGSCLAADGNVVVAFTVNNGPTASGPVAVGLSGYDFTLGCDREYYSVPPYKLTPDASSFYQYDTASFEYLVYGTFNEAAFTAYLGEVCVIGSFTALEARCGVAPDGSDADVFADYEDCFNAYVFGRSPAAQFAGADTSGDGVLTYTEYQAAGGTADGWVAAGGPPFTAAT
jgi:hypothetical protein